MDLAKVFSALSNEVRLKIYKAVYDNHELSVGEINKHVPELSQSALSQHLKVFRDTGLMTTIRQSQTIFYSLTVSKEHYKLSVMINELGNCA